MKAKGNMRKWVVALAAALCLTFGMAVSCCAAAFDQNQDKLNLNNQWTEREIPVNVDYHYSFAVPSDGRVTLQYQSTCYQTEWTLYTADKTLVVDSERIYWADPNTPKTSTRELDLTRGDYYIKVRCTSDQTGKNIRLRGFFESGNTTDSEPNDSFGQAMSLQKTRRETGMFTKTDRVDFYKIYVPNKSEVSFRVTSMVYYMELTLYDGDTVEIGSYNIAWGYPDSPKSYEATKTLDPGTYYVKMTPSGNNTGIYYLSYTNSAVSSITLNHSSLKMELGANAQLKATVLPSDAVNKNVTWSSSDTGVIYVDESGNLRTQNCGQAVVTATAADGTGVKASCTVTVVPGKPTYPMVVGGSAKKDSLQLNWTGAYGASGYRVFKYNAKTKKYEKYKDTSKTTMKVSKLAAETKYKFKVAAYVQIGNARELGADSSVCTAYTAPKKVKATSITSKKVVKKSSYSKTIQLKWKKVSGATGYRVYVKAGSGGYYSHGTTKKTSMKISLSNRTTYRFKVVAYRTKHKLTTNASASKVVKYRS